MADDPKRVKGIFKKETPFTGLHTGVVYEFSFIEIGDSSVVILIYHKDSTYNYILPKPYIEEFIQILDGPAADILFSNNK